DAAQRNPFERRFRPSAEGLAPLDAPDGTLALYSVAPGKVIAENTGANSPFVSELIKELRSPNLTAEEVFNRARIGVSRASNNDQVPWVASSLTEEFYFGTSRAAVRDVRQRRASQKSRGGLDSRIPMSSPCRKNRQVAPQAQDSRGNREMYRRA